MRCNLKLMYQLAHDRVSTLLSPKAALFGDACCCLEVMNSWSHVQLYKGKPNILGVFLKQYHEQLFVDADIGSFGLHFGPWKLSRGSEVPIAWSLHKPLVHTHMAKGGLRHLIPYWCHPTVVEFRSLGV
jgi:hypothetical protein